ncbi:MAG: putative replicase protein [Koroslivirus allofaecihabitans]|uniref:RNA-directed RNA polymerase n=1 Tax=Leviviridae sp. TaxID=2027243 RepID=A0ABY3STE1_9VIRU|nr:MAG: putative replicase protein [Leviviridae sp.]
MQNSHARLVQGAIESILLDAIDAFPDCRQELDRDLSRLLTLFESRGLSFFTIDLPEGGKWFDHYLSSGSLGSFPIPGFGKKIGSSSMPLLLGSLMSRVFDLAGVLRPIPDITAILFLRQIFCFAKKLRITCDESRTQESVRDFFRIESEMRDHTLDWVSSAPLPADSIRCLHLADGLQRADLSQREVFDQAGGTTGELFELEQPATAPPASDLLENVQRTADALSGFIGYFDSSNAQWRTKHGPGAVSDLRGGVSKYSFPHWPEKLEGVFPMADFAFANYRSWVDAINSPTDGGPCLSRHEPPSRLIAVPKSQKGPRLIASEPTSHQWCQQAVMNFLRSRVDSTPMGRSIKFFDQTGNQQGALRASRSGTHWTIDLSSASDRMSLWCVERIFRRNPILLNALHASRTRWMENTINPDCPKYIVLKKLAPQGAAFTFPVQSILYYTVIVGCMIHAHGLKPSVENIFRMGREVHVFGDDLIVPKTVGESVIQVLEYLGFKVNNLKTYKTGKFRESCGLEAYDGVEVTPAYVLEPYDSSTPTSVASVVDSSNNLHSKGFWHTAEKLVSTLPSKIREKLAVVPDGCGSFGLTSFCGSSFSHLVSRWDRHLQQMDRKTLTVVSSVGKIPDQGDSCLLQYFTEAPRPEDFWMSGVNKRPVTVIRDRWVPELLLS